MIHSVSGLGPIALPVALLSAACTAPGVQRTPRAAEYWLPFPPGQAHKVVQSFNGPYGHSDVNAYAYDFTADIGSEVTAARGGAVIHMVEFNPDALPRKPEPGKENVVVIGHGDGTFGRYYHLTQNGAEVDVGMRVRTGQTLGRSGNSGSSFMPHLHFDVTKGCFEYGCPTVRFKFEDIKDDPLIAGQSYSRHDN